MSRPLRVIFCIGTLGAGGLERFVTRISVYAQQSGGIEPVVLCLAKRVGLFVEPLERAGIAIIEAPSSWMRRPNQWWRLVQMLRRVAPDIIHSQVNFSLLQQCLAARAAGVRTFCVTERNTYPLTKWGRWRRIVQFHAIRHLGAHYSANGTAVAAYLERMVFAAANSIPVLPNGVPLIARDERARLRIREEHGWDPSALVIGYISRMAAHKGHTEFLSVVAQLRREGEPIHVCLIGDGPQRAKLEEQTQALGLQGCVTFTGIIPNVDEYLHAFDIVVLLSQHEGMPNVILEAMAAGKPILATPVGAIPELLDRGQAGLIAETTDERELARLLQRLLHDPQLRWQLGQRAQRRIADNYSIQAVFSHLLGYYQQVLPHLRME